jgi:hypothetical protein
MNRIAAAVGLFLVLACTTAAWAGGYPPVCMAVDRVVLEPSREAPTRIQIWGKFYFLKEPTAYGSPVSGYLYYTVEKGKEDECRKDWAKLRELVAAKRLIAFGSCGQPKHGEVRLRKPTDKPDSPTVFPLTEAGFTDGAGYARDLPKVEEPVKGVVGKTPRK